MIFLQKSCELGSGEACLDLVYRGEFGFERQVDLVEMACSGKAVKACLTLAEFADSKETRQMWLGRACVLESAAACSKLEPF